MEKDINTFIFSWSLSARKKTLRFCLALTETDFARAEHCRYSIKPLTGSRQTGTSASGMSRGLKFARETPGAWITHQKLVLSGCGTCFIRAVKCHKTWEGKNADSFKGEARNNSTGDLRSIIPKPGWILVLLCSNWILAPWARSRA